VPHGRAATQAPASEDREGRPVASETDDAGGSRNLPTHPAEVLLEGRGVASGLAAPVVLAGALVLTGPADHKGF